MVTLSPASIALVTFPFSDLSSTKLRPALVLADANRDDWLLCQITSNSYSDPIAVKITNVDLQRGKLDVVSFARPLKLFTANESLIVKRIAILNDATFKAVLTTLIQSLQQNMPVSLPNEHIQRGDEE